MTLKQEPDGWDLCIIRFWKLKHSIDDEVNRVGWSVERARVYLQQRYGVQSRLAMTDDQLIHLLTYLKSLPDKRVQVKQETSKFKLNRRKKRR